MGANKGVPEASVALPVHAAFDAPEVPAPPRPRALADACPRHRAKPVGVVVAPSTVLLEEAAVVPAA